MQQIQHTLLEILNLSIIFAAVNVLSEISLSYFFKARK